MMYRPVMNPIDAIDPRRRQPVQQTQGNHQQVVQALMAPQNQAFALGRNFEGMFNPPQTQQPQMGRLMRPGKGMR